MAVLAMFCLGTAVALLIGCTIDAMKQKAYWEGRRAGYARGIADTRNFIIK